MSYLHAIKMALICMSGIALSGCLEEEIDARQPEIIQGLIYKLHDNEPFSGRITGFPSRQMGLTVNTPTCNLEVKKGLPDGEAQCYFSNGQLGQQLTFAKGLIDGTWKEWTAEGELLGNREFQQHKLHGKSEIYNILTGKLLGEHHYENGERVGTQKVWSADGELITDLQWSNGKKTGFETDRDWEYRWRNGKKDGVQKRYWQSDEKRVVLREEEYLDGVLHGSVRNFDKDGNLATEETYAEGAIQSRTERHLQHGKNTFEKSFVRAPEKDSRHNAYDALVPDGIERTWDLSGNLTKEIKWEKGKPLSGLVQQWRDGVLISSIQGVPSSQNSRYLIKQGLERIYDDEGPASVIIEWNRGKMVAIAARHRLPFDSNEHVLRLLRPEGIEVVGGDFGDSPSFFNQLDTSDYLHSIVEPAMSETTLSTAIKATRNVADCINRYQQYLARTGNRSAADDMDFLTRACS